MKVAFDTYIHNDLEKKEKIHKLCLEIQSLARHVYVSYIKEETFGKFCDHFKPNGHSQKQMLQSDEAQSSAAAAAIEADTEIE